jgi:hypothetical protein
MCYNLKCHLFCWICELFVQIQAMLLYFGWVKSDSCTTFFTVTSIVYCCARILIVFHNWPMWFPKIVVTSCWQLSFELFVWWCQMFPFQTVAFAFWRGIALFPYVLKVFDWFLPSVHHQPTKFSAYRTGSSHVDTTRMTQQLTIQGRNCFAVQALAMSSTTKFCWYFLTYPRVIILTLWEDWWLHIFAWQECNDLGKLQEKNLKVAS